MDDGKVKKKSASVPRRLQNTSSLNDPKRTSKKQIKFKSSVEEEDAVENGRSEESNYVGTRVSDTSGSQPPLRVIVKGKPLRVSYSDLNDEGIDEPPLTAKSTDEMNDEYEEDEEEDEDQSTTNYESNQQAAFNVRLNLNTPASENSDEHSSSTSSSSTWSRDFNKKPPNRAVAYARYLRELKSHIASNPKPAILPAIGTTSTVKFTERKLALKNSQKTAKIQPDIQRRKVNETIHAKPSRQFTMQNLDPELEREVNELLDEARRISNISGSSSAASKLKKSINPTREAQSSANVTEASTAAPSKNSLLKSVESLITGIKSGHLIKEQEQSNKRIQEILMNLFDKDSLDMFELDTSKESADAAQSSVAPNEESRSGKVDELPTDTSLSNQPAVEFTQDTGLKAPYESTRADETFDERTSGVASKAASVNDNEEEMIRYLASLPVRVTDEEILNTTGAKAKLNERLAYDKSLVDMKYYKMDKAPVAERLPEDRYNRNLHLFCSLEHQNRNILYLPTELIDVTRKYHTRDRYDHNLIVNSSANPSATGILIKKESAHNGAHSTSFVDQSLDKSAKNNRMMNKIDEIVQIDEQKLKEAMMRRASHSDSDVTSKSGKYADNDVDNDLLNDSGIDEIIESWRLKAEEKFKDNSFMEVEGKRMELNVHENMNEYSLTFLRPAPPKMSVKLSSVRESLFAKYKSSPPVVNNIIESSSINRSIKKSTHSRFIYSLNNSSHDYENDDYLDDEMSGDENLLEEQNLLLRILSRKYNSDVDLSSDPDETPHRLVRSFSDTMLNRSKSKRESGSEEDYEFLKIDSNYYFAIEEALSQKKRIKLDYMKRSQTAMMKSNSSKMDQLSSNMNMDENSRMDDVKTIDQDEINSICTEQPIRPKKDFFPKNLKKTPAELAIEAGRNYILTEKKKKKSPKSTKGRLNMDILDRIEKEIYEKNVRPLTRSNSMERMKFYTRMQSSREDDQLMYLTKREIKSRRKASVPGRLNFAVDFARGRSFAEPAEEREWVRGIWSEWFDEVVPQLDGTFKNQSLQADEPDKNDPPKFEFLAGVEPVSSFKEKASNMESEEDETTNSSGKLGTSPTPYRDYAQIDIDLDNDNLDVAMIQSIEQEIRLLDECIQNQLNAFDLARRGTLYRKLGFIKKALDDLNLAIDMEPNFVDAYWQRHLVYIIQDRKTDALEDLNKILTLNRTHSGAYLSRGDLYALKNDSALAIVNYAQAIKYNPNDYQAYYKRAKMYESRGDIRMAMDDYLTTTKLNPKISEAWFKHGFNYFQNRNWHYAIVDFTEMIKHNPGNQARARLYRGKCYLNLKDYQQALDDFTTALHLDPNDWQSYYHRACLLRKLDPNQALSDYSISLLIESGYDNLNSYLHRAILYCDRGMYEEALQDFESVLELDKEFAPAYVNIGIINMNLTLNYWKAIKYFNMAIKSNPVYIRAYLCRAQAYRSIHDLKNAFLDYTRAIHLDPMNTKIYIYRGQVVLEMGDLNLAAFCVQHAAFMSGFKSTKAAESSGDDGSSTIEPNNNNPASIFKKSDSQQSGSSLDSNKNATSANQTVTQQAVVLAFLKEYDQSVSILAHELKLKPSSDLYNLLGRIQMRAKRWKEAIVAFENSIEYIIDNSKAPSRSVTKLNQTASKMFESLSKSAKQNLIDAYFQKGQCQLEVARYEEAFKSFDKVIEISPSNPQAFYYRGLAKAHLNQSKSIQDFNKALSLDPDLYQAFLGRACIYGSQQRYTKAILNCNQAIRINPKSVRSFLYRGALKYLAKTYAPAIDDLTEAIKLDQTCSLAYYNRALCHQQLNELQAALKDYSVVLMLGDYLNYRAFINRALVYFQMKDYSNALNDFTSASAHAPNDQKINHMMGVCLHKLGEYDKSIDKLTETFQLNTSFVDALISRGNVYVDYGSEPFFSKALMDYEHVLLKEASNVDAHINLGYLYQIMGRFKLAWEQFTTAIKFQPKCVPLYEGRSVVCLQMSDTSAAMKDMNHAVYLKPCAELLVNRGVIYQFMADNVNAIRDYQSAILLNPKYALAYYNSANIFLLHKQYKQAIEFLDKAINMCGLRDECTYQNRAIAKILAQDHTGALRDLCEALKYNKYSAHTYVNRAVLLFKMENYSLAEKDLTNAINLTPNDPVLYKLRADCRNKLIMRDESIEDYKMAINLKQREETQQFYGIRKIY